MKQCLTKQIYTIQPRVYRLNIFTTNFTTLKLNFGQLKLFFFPIPLNPISIKSPIQQKKTIKIYMCFPGKIILRFLLFILINSVNGQEKENFPQESIPNTEVRLIHSSFVGDDFKISIALPQDYNSSKETYPVLYITDANSGFAAVTQMARVLQWDNEVPKMIIVGIGYPSDSLSRIFRSRDYTPSVVPDSLSFNLPTGGAPKFLRFIKEELMPFIKNNYRTSPIASYAGVSYGGLFGLYVLFHEPSIFQRYVIASPALFFDHRITLKFEEQYASTHPELNAKIFMCAGELEETKSEKNDFKMISTMQLLSRQMLSRHYKNFYLKSRVFSGETHYSIFFSSFGAGLRDVFKP